MSISQSSPVTAVPTLEWAPVVAGAIAAAAISFVLLTFGAAVGLTLASPWPNAGASAITVAIVVGVWLMAVQAGSFAAGGYLAGRLRSARLESTLPEGQFRDGAHGFLVWALGVLFGSVLLGLTGLSALKTTAQSTAMVAGGAASGAAAKGTESALATGPVDYAVDYVFRPASATAQTAAPRAGAVAGSPEPAQTLPTAPRPSGVTQGPSSEDRAEVARVFTQTIRNQELTARDRDYLTQVVVRRTGMLEADAQKRVDEAINEAKNLEIKAREAADKARKAALIAGFLTAVSLLLGAAAASAGASLGGRHRDEGDMLFFGRRFW
jgi:hypothetical protein